MLLLCLLVLRDVGDLCAHAVGWHVRRNCDSESQRNARDRQVSPGHSDSRQRELATNHAPTQHKHSHRDIAAIPAGNFGAGIVDFSLYWRKIEQLANAIASVGHEKLNDPLRS